MCFVLSVLETINNLSDTNKYTSVLFEFNWRQKIIYVLLIVLISSVLGGFSYYCSQRLDKKPTNKIKYFLTLIIVSFCSMVFIEIISSLVVFNESKADKLISQEQKIEHNFPCVVEINFKEDNFKYIYLTNDPMMENLTEDNKNFVVGNNFNEKQIFIENNVQDNDLFLVEDFNNLKLFKVTKKNLMKSLKEYHSNVSLVVEDTNKEFGSSHLLRKQMRTSAKLNCINKNLLFKHLREDFCFEEDD